METPAYTMEQDTEEFTPEQLAAIYLKEKGHPEPYWTTDEVQQVFSIDSFLDPVVFVTRKEDNQPGTITWIDLDCVIPGKYARLYFMFVPSTPRHFNNW